MPGALVEMGLNPLLPLTSQVSRWLWPPKSQIMMQDWLWPFGGSGHQAGQLEIVAQAEPHVAESAHFQKIPPARQMRPGDSSVGPFVSLQSPLGLRIVR